MPKTLNPLQQAREDRKAKVAALSEAQQTALADKEKALRKARKELKAAKETVKELKAVAEAAKNEVDAILG